MAWLPHAHGPLPRRPRSAWADTGQCPRPACQPAVAAHLHLGRLALLSPPLLPLPQLCFDTESRVTFLSFWSLPLPHPGFTDGIIIQVWFPQPPVAQPG